MSSLLCFILMLYIFMKTSSTLLCYNCSSTHLSWNQCGGQFTSPVLNFNNSRHYLVNCTAENSMCYVRSWSTRAKLSWIVQRGCYQLSGDDPFPRAMNTPNRAMTCKYERLVDAEYKVCLCNANWCNTTTSLHYQRYNQILFIFTFVYLCFNKI